MSVNAPRLLTVKQRINQEENNPNSLHNPNYQSINGYFQPSSAPGNPNIPSNPDNPDNPHCSEMINPEITNPNSPYNHVMIALLFLILLTWYSLI